MDHAHHDMPGMATSVTSMTTSMVSMATSTMSMAATATSSMDMSGMDHSGHSMGSSGMDHSGHTMDSSGMDHSGHSMNMGVFHWGFYDTGLWLPSWVPSTNGALVGACFGLFFISFFSRTLPALEAYFVAWKKLRDNRVTGNHHAYIPKKDVETTTKTADSDDLSSGSYNQAGYPNPLRLPIVPAFSWTTDTIRSFITAVNAFVGYLLMMAVMTGNGAYFLVVILGVLFGEIAFGRFRSLNGFADDHAH